MHDEYTEQHLADLITRIKEKARELWGVRGWLEKFRDDPALPEALVRIFEELDPSADNFDDDLAYTLLQGTHEVGKPVLRPLMVALERLPGYAWSEDLVKYVFRALPDAAYADEVVPEVFEELILRRSGRPDEYFSAVLVARVLEKAIEYKPRLHGKILRDLCELAYEYDGDVRRRAVAVARQLGAGEFASLVKSRAAEDPMAAAEIMRILGGNEATAFFSDLQSQALERFRAPLMELEKVSRQRWNELSRQARSSFYISMGMSVGLFVVGAVIVIWGLVLLTRSGELSRQIGGGILSALAALATTFSGRFWKDPVEHIQRFSAQQARLQAAFIGYMNRVAQLRLMFEHEYATGGITLEKLETYQGMLSEAIDQASQQLVA